jgi:hypothetical protein
MASLLYYFGVLTFGGYDEGGDIILRIPNLVVRNFLIEFKYVSLKKAELSGEQAKKLSISELKALEPVKDKLAESKTQLNNYRQILLSRYGKKLRLHSYSVVAVGYERLVVCEI